MSSVTSSKKVPVSLKDTMVRFILDKQSAVVEKGATVVMESDWYRDIIPRGTTGKVLEMTSLDGPAARVKWPGTRTRKSKRDGDVMIVQLHHIKPYVFSKGQLEAMGLEPLVSVGASFGKIPAPVRVHFGLT